MYGKSFPFKKYLKKEGDTIDGPLYFNNNDNEIRWYNNALVINGKFILETINCYQAADAFWYRKDISRPAKLFEIDDTLQRIWTVSAGANPISWETEYYIKTSGDALGTINEASNTALISVPAATATTLVSMGVPEDAIGNEFLIYAYIHTNNIVPPASELQFRLTEVGGNVDFIKGKTSLYKQLYDISLTDTYTHYTVHGIVTAAPVTLQIILWSSVALDIPIGDANIKTVGIKEQ